MKFDPNTFTYGYELELGDVSRNLSVPEKLGSWEYAETDVCNIHEPYWGRASDPLGIEPPMGGEVNVRPCKTIEETINRIGEIIQWFRDHGDEPSASCTNVGHVHIHVPNLIENGNALRRITQYIYDNQKLTIQKCWGYKELPEMKESKTARTYMKWDGGREMPEWMAHNIFTRARDFQDFIDLQCCGKDGISRGRPFRYAINTYCLKHTKTVEFRCFRASLNLEEITDSFRFAKEFMNAALNTNEPVASILARNNFKFPPFTYDHELYSSWEKTKWSKDRGKKNRKYYDV